jgi:EmrB/QacA subfamily drug resistance transporter
VEAGVEEAQPLEPALRRLVWILVLGALAPALDTTIVNVALPTLGRDLDASVATSQWTITGYLLAIAIAMPVTGWATVRFGGKRMWLASLGVFLAGSALAGAAWSIGSLIVFRLLQGVGAGLMLPIVTTLLVQAAGPRRLGRLIAIASLPVVVVPIFGPVIGGLIVDNASWRWVFYVNVPICLAAIGLAWRAIPADPPARRPGPFDLVGLLLLSPGLALLVYGLSQASGGFAATRAIVPLLLGLALAAAFVVHALRRRESPLIDLRILRIRSYAAAMAVFSLTGLSLYGPLLLFSLYYQEVQGRSVLATGLLLAPQGLGSLLPRTIVGRLTDTIGPRLIVIAGLLLTTLGTVVFTQAGPGTSEWLLAAALFVRGAGLSSVTIAVMAGAFREVRAAEVPDASAATRIVQQIGGSFGAAVLAVILARELGHHTLTAAARGHAFDTAFWWAIAFSLLPLLPALALPAFRREGSRRTAARRRRSRASSPCMRPGGGSSARAQGLASAPQPRSTSRRDRRTGWIRSCCRSCAARTRSHSA